LPEQVRIYTEGNRRELEVFCGVHGGKTQVLISLCNA
jgi:hypothetical protein